MRRILVRLGEDATFTHAGGPAASVKGVFTSAHQAVSVGPLEISSAYPTFTGMTADLPLVEAGDVIQVVAGVYSVRDVQHDKPSGVTVLELEAGDG